MVPRNVVACLFAMLLIANLPMLAKAGITFRLPDITVHPGDSGTFDAVVEFNGSPPPPPPYYVTPGFRVTSYSASVVVAPGSSGFRMPSAADGFFGPGSVTVTANSVGSSDGVACAAIFPPSDGCPPVYPAGSQHLLLRADYQVNANVTPGTQFALNFGSRSVTDFYGRPYPIDNVVNGNVTVAAGDKPILGGPIGPAEFPGRTRVEEFNFNVPSPVAMPLVVSNAVITTTSGDPLHLNTKSDYIFGAGLSQYNANDSMIADFTVDTLRAGAWVGGYSNREVTAAFYAGDTLLGETTVHSLYNKPVFLGFESKAGFITRAVFTRTGGGGTTFSLDRLTTDVQAGDFNGDGNVNAADYTVWRNSRGQSGPAMAADQTGPGGIPDGVVDSLDYALWKSTYGFSASASAAAILQSLDSQGVPEPNSLAMAVLIALPVLIRRSPRR